MIIIYTSSVLCLFGKSSLKTMNKKIEKVLLLPYPRSISEPYPLVINFEEVVARRGIDGTSGFKLQFDQETRAQIHSAADHKLHCTLDIDPDDLELHE